jgi:imidazolonepropionase
MIEADLAVVDAEDLLTLAGPAPRLGAMLRDPGAIRGGSLAARDGVIVFAGPTAEFRREVRLRDGAVVIDGRGRTVLPGFVDPHTHLPFAGWREDEMVQRLAGATYESIAAAGGGIQSTVSATRRATEDDLVALGGGRLDRMLLHGTTTIEAKSGYGLTRADEIKQLEALKRLAASHPVTIVPTFLGAHIVPAERRADRGGYVSEVVGEMLPEIARRGLARYCDVFIEEGAFTVDEGETILRAAAARGLGLRVHADQRRAGGGAALAGRLGAASADHLDHVDDAGIEALRRAGTTAVLLPGASFFLRDPHDAPARRLVDAGVTVALATDFNPGTCPTEVMTAILPIACLRLGLLPAEAIAAATVNAAHSLGLAGRIGSLEPGKDADLQVLDVPNHVHLVYRFGINTCCTVIKKGRVVVDDGRRVAAGRRP